MDKTLNLKKNRYYKCDDTWHPNTSYILYIRNIKEPGYTYVDEYFIRDKRVMTIKRGVRLSKGMIEICGPYSEISRLECILRYGIGK